ncbi:MAG: response regulator [Desulfobulbaceae bacterium]|nr:response regulator [Desulfobulbaceae bacterium]
MSEYVGWIAVREGREMKKKHKILVIDDDETVLEIIEHILASTGYHVQTALSGRKGLELAEMADGNVDLLLTDVVMPEMSGEDLALVFKRTYPATKVLFMSAYLRPGAGRYEELHGKVEFIVKPFTSEKLKGEIKRILA